jgi:hypothetical protein
MRSDYFAAHFLVFVSKNLPVPHLPGAAGAGFFSAATAEEDTTTEPKLDRLAAGPGDDVSGLIVVQIRRSLREASRLRRANESCVPKDG